ATVVIETITAAFEMEEILYELREHAAGLAVGRWDYVFSIVKGFRSRGASFVLPDRSRITADSPFLRAHAELLVESCRRRGAQAIGGTCAVVLDPSRPETAAQGLERLAAEARREAADGFDGTSVADPGLVAAARAEFD